MQDLVQSIGVNFQWQLWEQIIGFNLTLDPGTQQQVVVLQICQENLVFVNAVYIFASLRRGGLELYLTLARGGSRLFVQISQETSNGGGSKGRQGVKSVMERDHPNLPATSFLTKEKEQKESPPCQPPNLRSHGNQCIVSKSNHRVSTILSIGVALITCFGCIYQELQICQSRKTKQ